MNLYMLYIYRNNRYALQFFERVVSETIRLSKRSKSISLVAIAFYFLLYLNPTTLHAQGVPLPYSKIQFFDNTGVPLSGGKVYTCVSGSSCPGTPQASYTDYTLGVQNANPVILDSAGRSSIWLGSATYKIVLEDSQNNVIWTQDGVPGPINLSTANINYTAPYTGAVQQTLNSALAPSVNVGNFGALGNGSHDDTSAIQACINGVPDGGQCYLPPGSYLVCTGLPLTISKRITLLGAGPGSIISVCSSAGSTTDALLIKASTNSDVQGFKISNLAILPQSGNPGRYGINFDGTNASFSNGLIDHITVGQFGNYAIATTNSSSNVNGNPYTTTVQNSTLKGGVFWNFAGDSITMQNDVMTGPNDLYLNLVNSTTGDNANGFLASGNNITNAGGITILNASNGVLGPANDIETDFTFTGTNGFINLTGNSNKLQNFKIISNTVNCSNLLVTNCIYIDNATHTLVDQNTISQASSKAVVTTSNATYTILTSNVIEPQNPISSWLTDGSQTTFISGFDVQIGFWSMYTGSGAVVMENSTTGVAGVLMTSSNIRVASNGWYGFTATTNAGTSPNSDTFINRQSANTVGIGSTAGGINGTLAVGILQAISPSASSILLNMTGAAGQTANYINIQTASSNPVFSVSPAGVLSSAGNAGLTVAKTAGSCVMTFTGGLLTSVTGC